MSSQDFTAQRLFVEADLGGEVEVAATPEQANYLKNVLRLSVGDRVLLFNGRDGEWRSEITVASKRHLTLTAREQTRPQASGPDIHYLFAPLKRSRLDYMVQKATELGAAHLRPVLTRYTTPERVNTDRMRANAIEAAEQCGILRIPEVSEPAKLPRVIEGWDITRRLIFCDEGAQTANPISALTMLPPGPMAVLIGPEGGFSEEERKLLLGHSFVTPISMGPRIMRADTAAVAALALVNAVLGDWR